ncbi:MAG: DNA polymerase III subunit delta [Bacteroidales bacterium]|nr:DNA polymerase III subunit delta [Bacteroidales bacterium]
MLFSEIIGQDEIKQRLIKTVSENRVAHAQLFYGEEGRGKLALALAYAQFICCKDANKFRNEDSCGTCSSCIKYNKLIHPDLHFIYPVAESQVLKGTKKGKKTPVSNDFVVQWREMILENNYYISFDDWNQKLDIERKQASINVADCGTIITTLSYSSYESEYKIMLIWMIEKLNYQAAPKLLKILEEPPEKTVFLLVAEQIDMIISTILSRLHQVKVPKIDENSLLHACVERLGLPESKAIEVTRLANGSFKKASKLKLQADTIGKNLKRFVEWMRICFVPDVIAILEFSESQAKENREQNKQFLQFGLGILRNSLMINLGHHDMVRMVETERNFYMKFAPFIHNENIEHFSAEFNDAIFHIERNVNAHLIFLDLSLTISKLLRLKEKKVAS